MVTERPPAGSPPELIAVPAQERRGVLLPDTVRHVLDGPADGAVRPT